MRLLAVGIFFVSGFAALMYQVIWQRLLVIFSGADVYSATIVVAAFMAGLGCGSLAGGLVADRVSRMASIALFGGAELGIALFGSQSRLIFYEGLYQRLGHLADQPAVMAILLFMTLLWPTFLMGASLPLLARALTRSVESAPGTIGWLYGSNTLGAAFGALCATWYFMPRQGLEGGLSFASTLNLACAGFALPLMAGLFVTRSSASALETTPIERAVEMSPPPASVLSGLGRSTWVALYALSGFLALSFEIVWFRLLGVMLKSTAFTFGTLLSQYLFWLGIGAALGSLVARRVRWPAVTFLAAQTGATIYAGLGLIVTLSTIERSPSLAWVRDYLAGYEPMRVAPATSRLRGLVNDAIWHTPNLDTLPHEFLWMYFVLPAIFVGPAAVLMGLGFPLMQRVVQSDLAHLGERVGTMLLANIFGSTLGTLVTGWAFLTWFGTPGTLKVLIAVSTLFALCAVSLVQNSKSRRYGGYVAVVLLGTTVVWALPGAAPLWAQLHGTEVAAVRFDEHAAGLAVLKARGQTFQDGAQVFLNGLGQSQLPYGGNTQTLLGALPAMLHPAPRHAAIVGLGSGDTVTALAGRRELERITSIEIVKPLIGLLRDSAGTLDDPGLTRLLADARIEHVFGDGRLFLRHSGRRFDIIEADALRPGSAYAGSLYSVEYFKLVQAQLARGGLAVSWAPTDRVERTFVSVFPYVARYDDVLIGGNEPISIDQDAILRRIDDPVTQHYYRSLDIDIRGLLVPLIWSPVTPEISSEALLDINTDLFPRDEFDIPVVFDLSMLRPEGSR